MDEEGIAERVIRICFSEEHKTILDKFGNDFDGCGVDSGGIHHLIKGNKVYCFIGEELQHIDNYSIEGNCVLASSPDPGELVCFIKYFN